MKDSFHRHFQILITDLLTVQEKTSGYLTTSITNPTLEKPTGRLKIISQTHLRMLPRALFTSFLLLNFIIELSYLSSCRLSTLASANSVPGVNTLYNKSLVQKIREVGQIFGTQSVQPDALVAPFREMALDLYMHMNDAIARFVTPVISHFCLCFSLSVSFPPVEARRIFEKSPRSPTKNTFWRCLKLLKPNIRMPVSSGKCIQNMNPLGYSRYE